MLPFPSFATLLFPSSLSGQLNITAAFEPVATFKLTLSLATKVLVAVFSKGGLQSVEPAAVTSLDEETAMKRKGKMPAYNSRPSSSEFFIEKELGLAASGPVK